MAGRPDVVEQVPLLVPEQLVDVDKRLCEMLGVADTGASGIGLAPAVLASWRRALQDRLERGMGGRMVFRDGPLHLLDRIVSQQAAHRAGVAAQRRANALISGC